MKRRTAIIATLIVGAGLMYSINNWLITVMLMIITYLALTLFVRPE